MTPEEIEKLDGRELDKATTIARGFIIKEAPDYDFATDFYYCYETEAQSLVTIGKVPDYARDATATQETILQGVVDFGGVTICGDMETWERGGLFIVNFHIYPACWFAPMGAAVCRAFLLAFYAAKERG